jgi:hypothetical protein
MRPERATTLSITNTQKREIKKNSTLDTLIKETTLNRTRKERISNKSKERRRLEAEIKKTKTRTTQRNIKKLNSGGTKRTFRG